MLEDVDVDSMELCGELPAPELVLDPIREKSVERCDPPEL
jgi:hypothetical protein